MNELSQIKSFTSIAPISHERLEDMMRVQSVIDSCPQIKIHTHHLIHGGMYARTIKLDAETVLMGALIKVPTTVIVCGKVQVTISDELVELSGYCVIPGGAGRKQLFVALEETYITMIFKTSAKTVEEAEREFTDEYESLMSHSGDNDVVITGD